MTMNSFVTLCLLTIASAASASSTIKPILVRNAIAHELITALTNSGVEMKSDEKERFARIEVSQVLCHRQSYTGLDSEDPSYLVPTIECWRDSEYIGRGTPLTQSGWLSILLEKAGLTWEYSMGGKSDISAKKIDCTIDTAVENPKRGRFSCKITPDHG